MILRREVWTLLLALPFLTTSSRHEVQDEVPASYPFPCDVRGYRSREPPTSVHYLRPGDIDVIGAIGDSLTAGTAAFGENIVDLFTLDNRGLAFSMGGQKTWRQYLTLPNILKEFNPKLIGYSLGDGKSENRNSQFNVAVAGAMDQDLLHEAKVLVRRISRDPRVDMQRHWKLINVWIGTNDMCSDECFDRSQTADTHRKNLELAIDYLYTHLPRTFVNLISAPYVPAYTKFTNLEDACNTLRKISCPCMFGPNEAEKIKYVDKLARAYQRAEVAMIASGRYSKRDDFTVEFQPTFLNLEFPYTVGQSGRRYTDFSFLALDCFHFSQKFHARAANLLWNNLLEDPGQKSTHLKPIFHRFNCPTPENPFLRTFNNSALNTKKFSFTNA
ncbi:phospholipase B1, membrane-associated-like [Ischnura elegans]|uniref:phospholipase B1, membrane-associated-like n=1 Tax=Ischnura elegans TaxID=197161 RepID=UPI001ED87059|nr:phospholipase B1, membrane-associated-like [Ischnura elegans]XP_046392987.1 phospholipase B1, membrane-associated-like [Ischnura elegans]